MNEHQIRPDVCPKLGLFKDFTDKLEDITLDEYKAAIRVRIAQDLGVKACKWSDVPDYPNDLNACHDLLQKLSEHTFDADQWETFGHTLIKLHPSACLLCPNGDADYHDFATIIADLTGLQICEAIILTLNAHGRGGRRTYP